MRLDTGQLAPTIIGIGGLRLLEQNFLVRAGGCYFARDGIAADMTRLRRKRGAVRALVRLLLSR